jgi:hypothetical protein
MHIDILPLLLTTIILTLVTFAGMIIIAFTYRDQQLSAEKDDPASGAIRKNGFVKFKYWLFWMTASIFSLFLILSKINPHDPLSDFFWIVTFIGLFINSIGFIWGIWGVIYFLNPDTVKKITTEEVKLIEKKHRISDFPELKESNEFLGKSLILEKKIKDIINGLGLVADKLTNKEKVDLLSINGVLNPSFVQELTDIIKTRSLILKGGVDKVENALINAVDKLCEQLDNYEKQRQNS